MQQILKQILVPRILCCINNNEKYMVVALGPGGSQKSLKENVEA